MFNKKKKIYYIPLDYYHVLVLDKKRKLYIKIDRKEFFLNYNLNYDYICIDRSFDDRLWR